MQAITVCQTWASLIICGAKRIETCGCSTALGCHETER
jgi:hypothetical protein